MSLAAGSSIARPSFPKRILRTILDNRVPIILVAMLVVMVVAVILAFTRYEGFADIHDAENADVYGTTPDADLRWQNLTVRPEAWGDPGDIHTCKCGPPSKLTVDRQGGHHALFHVCQDCNGLTEPEQLGNRWVDAKGCKKFDSASIGLDRRSVAGNQF